MDNFQQLLHVRGARAGGTIVFVLITYLFGISGKSGGAFLVDMTNRESFCLGWEDVAL